MANLNRITLIGNLTRDPDLRYTASGMAYCKIGLAVNDEWKDKAGAKQKKTTFFDITFWDKRAETVAKFCTKGQPLYVEGKMESTTKEGDNGEKRTYWGVKGENFQFLASRGESNAPSAPAGSAPGPINEEDIPF